GSSAGAVIEIVASGVPAGLGEPVYDKLDGDLASAMMTINAVKGVEIGAGMAAAALSGEENPDEIRIKDGKPVFLSNNSGGILGVTAKTILLHRQTASFDARRGCALALLRMRGVVDGPE